MAEPLELCMDPVLGELVWSKGGFAWRGFCEFSGRLVRLVLCPDNSSPTRDEQLAVIEPSRFVLARLREIEEGFRHQAAKQLASDVASQQPRNPARVKLPQKRFAEGLELQTVSIHGCDELCGELYYRSSEFFPDSLVTIYFNPDLSFDHSEIHEVPRPA